MLFIARFEDRPAAQHLRVANQAAHDGYVEAHKTHILVSGPLRRDDLGNPVGGLWYINADNRTAAERLCHEAPFWTAGPWDKVTLMCQQAPTHAYANMRIACL
jgi:uncharacterized protein YciI|tara:strand:- start:10779 stop:11087 length:309 start_codon:yes stop_codon:yes gene_type:complete